MQKNFIDGKKIRDEILDKLSDDFALYVLTTKHQPILTVVVVGENKVINQFVGLKKKMAEKIGVAFNEIRFDENIDTDFLLENIKNANKISDGLIVQLPLPKHIDEKKVLDMINVEIDVDLLNPKSMESFVQDKDFDIFPPVAGAVYEIMKNQNYNPVGKKNVLVGFGKLVGSPVGAMLEKMGAAYDVIRRNTLIKEELYRGADLIVSGAGDPNIIKSDMISDGVFLIDAGTSSANSKIVGDIDLACLEKSVAFSKTPGGVGPVAVVMIFKNLLSLLEKRRRLAKKS